jgi:hypothetical protein
MGVTIFDVVQANAYLGADDLQGQGQNFYVRPPSGAGASGKSPRTALATVAGAFAKCTTNRNDVVRLLAGHNTAASTSDYLSTTLDWSYNLTHLVGVPGGVAISPRARIAFISTYDTASNLFTVSGNACTFKNIGFFAGVAGTNPTGCVKVTGSRNLFVRCQIAGIGHDNNDIADAYSLYVSGSENEFHDCVIGLDTISRGTADNAELVLAGGARNQFVNCTFLTWAGANTHQFVKRAAASTDRSTIFVNCRFINFARTQAGGVEMLEVFDVATSDASPGGFIDLFECHFAGAAAWEASGGASGIVRATTYAAATASATTGGKASAVTGA